jgi:effector-binding domain-containing protein
MNQAEIDAQVRTLPATSVCYIVMHGPYDQMPKGFQKLYGWLGALGLEPEGMPMAVYLSDPSKTPEFEAEWELWAPFAGEAPESGPNEKGLGVKLIEETMVATTTHRGPYDSMRPTYTALMRWISDRSYEPSGPPAEVYISDPNEVPPEEIITEIRIPVKKVARAGAGGGSTQADMPTQRPAQPGEGPPEPTSSQPKATRYQHNAIPQTLPLEERARKGYSGASDAPPTPPRHVPHGE